MQLHTRDWMDNKELRRCSTEARAVLMDLMCLAHEGTPYGHLCDDIGPLADEYMASRCVLPVSKFRKALLELARNERIAQKSGAFFIPRMVADEELRLKREAGGKLGGNPALLVNHEVNLQGLPPSRVRTDTRSDSGNGNGSVCTSEVCFFQEVWQKWKRQRKEQTEQLVMQLVMGREMFDWGRFRENAPRYVAWCDGMRPEPWKFASLTLWEWIEGGMILPPEAQKPTDWMDEI
jgi:hypothetical protein